MGGLWLAGSERGLEIFSDPLILTGGETNHNQLFVYKHEKCVEISCRMENGCCTLKVEIIRCLVYIPRKQETVLKPFLTKSPSDSVVDEACAKVVL